MNKYLLLRDNKQSGPYTVEELAAKGMKLYDLVWLDGKSAAWRYASEIEELKAFAPAVEEQPFDRFYKRPEPAQSKSEVVSDHSRYEPKPVVTSTVSKKVYINFPANAIASKPKEQREALAVAGHAAPEIPSAAQATKPASPAPENLAAARVSPSPAAEPQIFAADRVPSVSATPPYQANLRKLNVPLYAAAAACLLLLATVAYLVINYNNQRRNIDELSALVKQLENKERTPSVEPTQVALVREVTPAVTPPPAEEQVITDEKPVAPKHKPAGIAADKKTNAPADNQAIVFKEKATVTPHSVESAGDEPVSAPHENIFKLVSVKPNKYKTGVLGGISNLQFELTNNSTRELHKVAIEVKYLGPEKKIVKKQMVYFENVAPGSQVMQEVPKSNRGVTIDYEITDIKS